MGDPEPTESRRAAVHARVIRRAARAFARRPPDRVRRGPGGQPPAPACGGGAGARSGARHRRGGAVRLIAHPAAIVIITSAHPSLSKPPASKAELAATEGEL